jgi:hypothetical protein
MMRELVRIASEEVTLYFAQRRPRELEMFEWTIDAKDPRRITAQEKWWRGTLAPLLESASRRKPFAFVKDAGFNYKYFERSFTIKKQMWLPGRPPEMMEGNDIKKMTTERMAFVDSRSETLIQVVDVLTSYLRRLLAREISGDDVSQALGRLQIRKGAQLLRLVTLSQSGLTVTVPQRLARTVHVMTSAARTLLKPERGRRPPKERPKGRGT